MTERRFETEYWNKPAIMDLPMKAKLLYLYLWTNIHCNQAGLYEIAIKTIGFETGLSEEEIPGLLGSLEKKVVWVPEQNLIWVKSFLRRQSKSPQFLAAAAKCLENVDNNDLVKEFIAYNQGYSLSIPYLGGINGVSVPHSEGIEGVAIAPYSSSSSLSNTKSLSLSGNKGAVKGEKRLSKEDKEIVSVWRSVSGFAMELPAMVELINKIRADFPGVDVVGESRKWAARKISEPLTSTSLPSGQIYNFMARRHKWDQDGRRKKGSIRKYGYCVKCHYSGPTAYKACPLCGGPYEIREENES